MPAASRARVLEATRRLAVRGVPFTVADVAASARVSRATVHRLFGSREALFAELELEPEPASRERALTAAAELISERPLGQVSMDEVAERAGLSRASLYRLFPGKPALFQELVRVNSPLEPIARVLAELGDRPPREVMPAIARAVAARLEGRTGIIRTLLYEVSGLSTESEEARQMALREVLGPAAAYLAGQMAAGRLRPVNPLVAIQAFAGPLALHLLTRDLAGRLMGYQQPLEEALDELVGTWLRGLSVDSEGGDSNGG